MPSLALSVREPEWLYVATRPDRGVDGLVEEALRGEVGHHRRAVPGADADVDVRGPTDVPPGVDRGEVDHAVGVGDLVAAQILLADLVGIAGSAGVGVCPGG
jgi:hypothetical protein